MLARISNCVFIGKGHATTFTFDEPVGEVPTELDGYLIAPKSLFTQEQIDKLSALAAEGYGDADGPQI